jgi:hypothetical protein
VDAQTGAIRPFWLRPAPTAIRRELTALGLVRVSPTRSPPNSSAAGGMKDIVRWQHHRAAKINGKSLGHACRPPSPARSLNQKPDDLESQMIQMGKRSSNVSSPVQGREKMRVMVGS